MVDEAISSLRNLFLVSVLIGAVWLLSWPSAMEKFALYRDARDLHAWLFLKERMAELKYEMNHYQQDIDGIFRENDGASITLVQVPNKDLPVRDERDITWVKVPIMVHTSWPTRKSYPISLEPARYPGLDGETVRLYRIQSEATDVPLSEYVVIFFREDRDRPHRLIDPDDNPVVISASETALIWEAPTSVRLRLLHQALPRINRPKSWDRIRIQLTQYGYTKFPYELSSRHPVLPRLQADSDPRLRSGGGQILGIQLSIGLFFTTVGLFLAAIAFAMIGPLAALRNSKSHATSSVWFLVVPTAGKQRRWVLEGLILAVTIIWGAFPLLVLILQLTADTDLEVVGGWALPFGAAGLVFSSIVFALAAWELRVFRRAGD